MLTTLGSICLAIWLNELDNSTGLGITSGLAPGAATLASSLAAFTPWFTRVPSTIPTLSVNNISVNESTFWVRNLSKRLTFTFSFYYAPVWNLSVARFLLKSSTTMDVGALGTVSSLPAKHLPESRLLPPQHAPRGSRPAPPNWSPRRKPVPEHRSGPFGLHW